ncbi:MAG: alkyl hydroperoxide reductase subunit C [Patescibacteria group bacterium]|nr:MAG: alkyl hydroperoxide reductase subunit C [Patescibacteria group bacterium]
MCDKKSYKNCSGDCGHPKVSCHESVHVAEIGNEIPDFEVDAFHEDDIKKIKLSDYRGKWLILFFYPADFTFVCPTELEEMADNYSELQKLDAEVLSVSADTVFAHKVWKDVSPAIKKIEFPMVSDPRRVLCEAFGTYIESEGMSLRGTFIIDPDGILRAVEINDNSIGRSAKELVRKLQAAKFVREHDGKVCPASWQPGGDTLEPGLDLAGKI